jgi:hypothetical protein
VLLRLLETLAVSGSILNVNEAEAAAELVCSNFLVPTGSHPSLTIADDTGVRHVELIWNPAKGAYSYFAGTDGLVVAPADEIRTYRVHMEKWLAWLVEELCLVNAGRPFELVSGHAWDLGDLWVTSKSKVPIVFARRITRSRIQDVFSGALNARAGRDGGIILTTSRGLRESWPRRFVIRNLRDVLTSGVKTLKVDVELLKGIYSQSVASALGNEPICLSPDNRVLVLNSKTLILRGSKQQSIMRTLFDAHVARTRLRTADVLADSSADTIAKAFHKSPNWDVLKRHVRQRGGFCWLEP